MSSPDLRQLGRDGLEFWRALHTGDVRSLLQAGTGNSVVQLFRYALVGGSTFLVDFFLLLLLTHGGVHPVPASGLSFSVGIACNFLLTKFFAFKSVAPSARGLGEVAVFLIISLVGLGLTMAFMRLFTGPAGLSPMPAKLVSAILVFFWNFLGRKFILYPGRKQKA